MKNLAALISFAALVFTGCQTFISADGTKHHQMFPVKDKMKAWRMDTGRFVKLPFDLKDYLNEVSRSNNKHVVTTIGSAELLMLSTAQVRNYVYLWDPRCPSTLTDIHKLDSLAANGERVMIISLRVDYDNIHNLLGRTRFSKYPYYVIEADKYGKVLLRRKIRLIKEACNRCYRQYRDDLAVADFLLVENGAITPVMYNDRDNINVLRR